MKSTLICKIDNSKHMSYRHLSNYLKQRYNILAKEYHDIYLETGCCKECGKSTKFKNLQVGYRDFCSVLCLNRNKSKNPKFLKKISVAQKGIPRQKHSTNTKEKCRQIMLLEWINNKETRLRISKDPIRNRKISESVSKIFYKKNITYVNNIRCESNTERDYIHECIRENKNVIRFNFNGRPSIETPSGWRVPDFIENNNVVIDVKDFHPWFRKEMKDGLIKYYEIQEWCIQNGLEFMLWFKRIGHIKIEDVTCYAKS